MIAIPAARAPSHGLWDRIQAFSFDAGAATFPFWSRLASENGWSLSFAARAIGEYRRFVYLAVVAGHPVSPSDHVDQVWHLHLLYTESYWDRLCRDTLGRPLHHHPTTGGGAEQAKFDDWYRRTLESYRRLFLDEPPTDIWPRPEAVAGEDHYQRVNTRRCWIIQKPWVWWTVSTGRVPLTGTFRPRIYWRQPRGPQRARALGWERSGQSRFGKGTPREVRS